jgi:hypothetical protein
MKKLLTTSLSTLAAIATGLYLFPATARACDFGCTLVQGLGRGFGTSAAAGITSAIVNHHNSPSPAQVEDEQVPASASSSQEEYYRGVQDGINGMKYDNPNASADYDKGYTRGLQERREAETGASQ